MEKKAVQKKQRWKVDPIPSLATDSGQTKDIHRELRDQAKMLGLSKDPVDSIFNRSKTLLEALWEEMHVEQKDREYVSRQYFFPLTMKNYNFVSKELSSLLKQRTYRHKVLTCIEMREQYLEKLKIMSRSFSHDTATEKQIYHIAEDLEEIVQSLRSVTVECVEAVVLWRECLTKPQPFKWDGVNYLLKMQTDLEFLQHTDLVYLLGIPLTNNPLLIPEEVQNTTEETLDVTTVSLDGRSWSPVKYSGPHSVDLSRSSYGMGSPGTPGLRSPSPGGKSSGRVSPLRTARPGSPASVIVSNSWWRKPPTRLITPTAANFPTSTNVIRLCRSPPPEILYPHLTQRSPSLVLSKLKAARRPAGSVAPQKGANYHGGKGGRYIDPGLPTEKLRNPPLENMVERFRQLGLSGTEMARILASQSVIQSEQSLLEQIKKEEQENVAALKIQRHFRGFLGRRAAAHERRVQAQLDEKMRQEKEAARIKKEELKRRQAEMIGEQGDDGGEPAA